MLQKKALCVLSIHGKQPISGSILSCIFVIEAMLVCTTNSIGTSQLFISFQHSAIQLPRHIECLMFHLIHPADPFAIRSMSLFLMKPITWLDYVWNSALSIISLHLLGRCRHTHKHTLGCTHTCIPLKAPGFRKIENSLQQVQAPLIFWNPPVTAHIASTTWAIKFEFSRSCAILAKELSRFSES